MILGLLPAERVNHRHRFTRCVVVQAQNDQIGLRHQVALGSSVFAQFRRDAEHLDGWHGGQTLANLQASRASFAINKYFISFSHIYILKMY